MLIYEIMVVNKTLKAITDGEKSRYILHEQNISIKYLRDAVNGFIKFRLLVTAFFPSLVLVAVSIGYIYVAASDSVLSMRTI